MSSYQPDGPVARTAKISARVAMLIVLSMVAGVVAAGALLPFVGGVGLSAKAASNDFEALSTTFVTPPLPQQSLILASDGSKIATISYTNRIEVSLSQVAPVMRQAIVAIEDGRFYQHNGFDVRGFLRAAVGTSSGGQVQGGSTLTQQYVKQVLINAATTKAEVQDAQARTLTRKIKELRYALALEKELTKDQILERYLNIAYFGAGAYGIEAASRRYFGISASKLSLVQAATLAGLVQQPIAYNPIKHPNQSQNRRTQVLTRMADQGYISTKVAAATAAIPTKKFLNPRPVPPSNCTSSWAPFFCDYVIHVIKNNPAFGATAAAREALLQTGGLIIRTTLNPKIQADAVKAVTDYIPIKDKSGKVAALSMVQPGTGKILAMAQNRLWGTKGAGFTTYNFNVGTAYGGSQGAQAGSTFKPFTMAAALEQGISPYQIINSPYQETYKGLQTCDGSGKFVDGATIHNDSTNLNGPMNMLKGTALSVNTYYMGLEQLTGLCDPIKVATALGVKRGNGNPLGVNLNFTLGVDEVTPLTMAEAYATFANHGSHCDSIAITSVTDRNKKLLPIPSADCQQVIPREVADSVTAILSQDIDGPIAGRTGQGMSLGRQAAGKTGTINGSAAVWFAGYTPELSAAVWTGDPRGGYGHPMQNIVINGKYYDQVYGNRIPGPIWKQTMLAALGTSPKTPFDLQTLDGLGIYVPPPPVVIKPPLPSGSPSPGASGAPSPGTSTAPLPSAPASPTPNPPKTG